MSAPAPAPAPAPGPTPSSAPPLLAGLVAVALAIAFVWMDPAGTVRGEAVVALARGGIPALVVLVAAMGAGGAVLRATAPDAVTAPSGWLTALGLGVALQGAGMGLFAMAGALGPAAAVTVVGVSLLGWAARPRFT